MILVDTGPLVALFNPREASHEWACAIATELESRLVTTEPVLAEAFYLLGSGSRGAKSLREFVRRGGLIVWIMDDDRRIRAFDLMDEYEDHPMDYADASLVAAAESRRITTIFTVDRADFATYRPRIGRTLRRFRLLQ